jgi:hypothetical protein
MKRPSALNTAVVSELGALCRRLAGVQDSEGITTHVLAEYDVWLWVQCFADFDYEYAWLVDVRWRDGDSTVSDYLAIFEGYDQHGKTAFRCAWQDQDRVFPEVPDLYSAMAWWAEWVKQTRGREHGGKDS